MTTEAADINMDSPPAIPDDEPKYGGYSRFEIELEVCPPSARSQQLLQPAKDRFRMLT